MSKTLDELMAAATNADWGQVVSNGGPPCFHLDGGCFCLRARRWEGHGLMHRYVSLADALRELIADAERADPQDHWPCARLVVVADKIASATLYAPGLPDGTHDVWCVPVARQSDR